MARYESKDKRDPLSRSISDFFNLLLGVWFLVQVGVFHLTFTWSLVGWSALWEGAGLAGALIFLGIAALLDD